MSMNVSGVGPSIGVTQPAKSDSNTASKRMIRMGGGPYRLVEAQVNRSQITNPRGYGSVERPRIRLTKNSTIKTRNSTRAIQAAVPATTPKPRTPAINPMIKKISAQLSMLLSSRTNCRPN